MSAPREANAPSLRRVLALGAVWASISAAALIAPGCYGRNCEGGTEVFGVDAGEGRMIDENRWESGPMDGTWLWFPRQRYYIFDVRAFGGRVPFNPTAFLSASSNPATNGGNMTSGSGNLTLFRSMSANRIDIQNDSCSDYYLRLVVDLPPLPPVLPDDGGAGDDASDGGIEDDASADEDAGDGGT
ncbi:MAG: hypothetical protein KF795_00050 [Labilithrix sp.]|nr:hypothetical protein [Labilithrix sp.]